MSKQVDSEINCVIKDFSLGRFNKELVNAEIPLDTNLLLNKYVFHPIRNSSRIQVLIPINRLVYRKRKKI